MLCLKLRWQGQLYEKGHVLIYLSHILPGQITCYCPRKMLLPRRQITRRKLCFYYTCKFGVISLKYVMIMSPLPTKGDIDLVWFFLPLLPLLLSEACPDHNFFVFRDISYVGLWPLTSSNNSNKSNKIVHWQIVRMCMTIRRCVAYRNDLRGTLTFDLEVK